MTDGVSKARRLHDRLVDRFSLSIRVPLSEYVHSEGPATTSLPFLKPTDLFQRLLTAEYSWLFFGGLQQSDDAIETLLSTFWAAYQKEHPDHCVFQQPERLSRTFPVTVHGDGGRTQKKQPLEVFSIQPVLGVNTAASKTMKCRCDASASYGNAGLGEPRSQCLNTKLSTYLTHFLVFAFPSKSYTQFDNILNSFLGHVMDDLALACQEGILTDTGKVFYPACIGFKLDMEWMAKVGTLTQSYQNVGHVNQLACCHECDAGKPGCPFEDINSNASWVASRFNTIPWRCDPPWKNLQFDCQNPAKFLRRDAFHIFRLGICRNYLASCIYLLIYMGCSSVSCIKFLL